jgi:hypothetical protein
LNDGSRKTNYPGTIDRGFTVHEISGIDSTYLKMGVEPTPEALHISDIPQTMDNVQYKICVIGRESWTDMSPPFSSCRMWKIKYII